MNDDEQRAGDDLRRALQGSRDPVAIIEAALEHPSLIKAAVAALAHCHPSAAAARTLVDAHQAKQAPSWLVACLLGHVRHREGYALVIDILRRGDRLLSESYAAEAAVRIAGADAHADLEGVIDTVDDGTVRKAAAHALGSLGTVRAMAFLAAAVARGRLHARTVADVLGPLPVPPEAMLEAMTSHHLESRRWPPRLIARRLRAPAEHRAELDRCARSAPLRHQLTAVLSEGEPLVWDEDARWIRAWLRAAEERSDEARAR